MQTWKAQKNPIRALAFSPDGKYLATGASNESTWKLHAISGFPAPEVVYEGDEATPYGCSSLSFSHDSGWLVGVGSARIWLVDLRSAPRIRSTVVLKDRAAGMFSSAAFCGNRLVGFGEHMMRWPVSLKIKKKATGGPAQKPTTLTKGKLLASRGETLYGGPMIVAPDESVIVATLIVSGEDGSQVVELAAFDAKSGAQLETFERTSTLRNERDPKTASFSPDGKLLAAAYGGTIAVFDSTTQKEIRAWSTGTKDINGLTFSGDSSRLLAVSNDLSARQWSTKSWSEVRAIDDWKIGKLTCVTTSADGCLFAAGSHLGRVVIWDAI